MLKRILQYGGYMLGANVLVALFTFFVGMLGAHARSKESFGDYAIYVLIYSVGMTFATSGANQAIQKFGEERAHRIQFAAIAYRGFFVLLAVGFVAAPITALVVGKHLALGVVAIPLIAFWNWTRSIVRSRFDARFEARLIIVSSLSKSISQLLFITMSDVEAALIYGDFVGLALTALFCIWFLASVLEIPIWGAVTTKLDRPFFGEVIRFAWPLWLAGEVYTIRSSIITSFTRVALGAKETATLAMGEQLFKIAVKPAELFGQAALPGLVRAKLDRAEVFERALGFAVLLFPTLAVGTAGLSPLLLELFGVADKYPEVPSILLLAAIVFPAAAVETTLLQYTVAEGESRAILYAQIFTLALMGALLYPLGEAYGVYGMVLTGIAGHAGYLVGLMVALRRSHPHEVRRSLRAWLVGTALIGVALGLLFATRHHALCWLWAFPAALGYAVSLYPFGYVKLPSSTYTVFKRL